MPNLLRLCLALVFSCFLLPEAFGQNDPVLQAQLQAATAGFQGEVSLYGRDLATGRTVALDADRPVPTASVIKLAILYTALEQIRAGKKHFSDRLTLRRQDQVPGSGVLLFFDTPMTLTLRDALTLMIAESDNTAANLAIDDLGLQTIDEQIAELGMKNTWLYKKVEEPAEGPMPADQPQYGLGKTTAREMAGLMERLDTCNLGAAPKSALEAAPESAPPAGTASDGELCGRAMGMLRDQFFRDGIPRYLEKLDTTEGESAIANKTGALDHVRNDVGAIDTKHGTIILSVFTHNDADTSWTADNQAELLIAKLAKMVVDAWAPGA